MTGASGALPGTGASPPCSWEQEVITADVIPNGIPAPNRAVFVKKSRLFMAKCNKLDSIFSQIY